MKTQWIRSDYTALDSIHNNFYGAGPELGLDAFWNITSHLYLQGNLSTAFMWGRWNIQDVYQRPAVASQSITATRITTNMSNAQLGTLMLDYFLGMGWHQEGRIPWSFKLGYEVQHWPHQARWDSFQQLPVHGDLTFQGATCGVSVDL
jgi:hypothetical protein